MVSLSSPHQGYPGHFSFPVTGRVVGWMEGASSLSCTGTLSVALSLRMPGERAAETCAQRAGALTGVAGGWHQVGRCISPGLGPVPSKLHLGFSTSPVCLTPRSPLPSSLRHQPPGRTAVAAAASAATAPAALPRPREKKEPESISPFPPFPSSSLFKPE